MPSIFKRPRSPYYFCSYRAPDGRWLKKSTKQTGRTEALNVCMAWENAAELSRHSNLTASQARKVLAEMVLHATGESLTSYTLEGWLSEWEANKAGGASKTTMLRYRQVMRDFKDHMGSRAQAPLTSITPGDVVSFRDSLRKEGRAITTCNTVVKKILSVPFEAARKLGYITTNPVAAVDLLKESGKTRISIREPFEEGEVKAIIQHARGDWRGAIILAATTGLRLGDVVALKWGDIDRKKGFIRIQTQKTGMVVQLPIHPDFEKFLKEQQTGIGNAPVFTSLILKRTQGKTGLSSQFRDLMVKAKIKEQIVPKTGNAGRNRFSKGFHAIRHTFISTLANAGVSSEVRQKLTAHSDDAVHKFYTHLELKTFQAAVKKIPSVL